MSVCRKLPDGTIQKIAGHTILLDANVSEVREGTVTATIASDNAYTGVVTFSDPMPDTDYTVILNVKGWNNDGNIFGTPWRILDKTTTGFTVTGWRANDSNTTQITYEYTAFKLVKLEGYTALQNKVNSPDDTPTIDSMNLVTSDGVARAIENASAVWKGTKAEWNALPATEKQTYDLAVLLDETLVKAVDREDGTETDVANLNKIVHLTKAEYDAMPSHDPDTYYMITDDTTIHQSVLDWDNAVELSEYTSSSNVYTTSKPGILKVCCGQRAYSVVMRVYDKTLINKYGIIGNNKDGCIYYGQAVSGETKTSDILVNKDAEIYITGYSCGYVHFIPYK